jgi:hypothetical protein
MTISNALTFGLLAWFGALAMLIAGRILTGEIDCRGLLVNSRGNDQINPERVVTVALVPAILTYYAIDSLNSGAVTVAGRMSMPDLPENLVTLLTGSNGLYLAGKIARGGDGGKTK